MNKKILIIGQKGLIGSNLFKYFKIKKLKVYSLSFESFLKKENKNINKFDIIVNCTSNQKFIENKYQIKNDNDLTIAKKIIHLKIKLVMLSTRKIYKAKFNIKELDKKKPNCNYSKNKLISEISVEKILGSRVLILRISNIISPPNKNKRKLHKTFCDFFFEIVKSGNIYKNNRIYKDFISIKKFNQIVFELIKKNYFGSFNVSLGKKIYINQLITWLNFYNPKKVSFINPKNSFNNDNFTLNNKKLMNRIKIKNNVIDLKNECLRISKNFFK
ncbi:sugar nucleotide-binding protein [Candidatus Pelagibacter sp.]|jgi:dTDP-4-dehydrorhamnose reductase|nr:sugar nucleotide-binding protein [Candidatus Pelagibacter sp.]